jgi:hypothetical protein
MRVRYQQGYLRLGRRKHGPDCWEFLWWDSELSGRRIRRKAVIATILQYPNVEDAWQASVTMVVHFLMSCLNGVLTASL